MGMSVFIFAGAAQLAAVLAALVFPALFYPETTLDVSWGNENY